MTARGLSSALLLSASWRHSKRRHDRKSRRLCLLGLMLHCFYLFDVVLIPGDEKGVHAVAVRALLGVLHRGIGLLAVLTEGDRGQGLYLQFSFLEKVGLFAGVEPEIREIAGDDAADFADLESHRTDLGQVILDGELVNGINDINNGTEFVHYLFFRFLMILISRLSV